MPTKLRDSSEWTSAMDGQFPSVQEGIYILPPTGQGGTPHLLGGKCGACGEAHFPRERYCNLCLGPVEKIDIGGRGTIYSFTVVRTKPPLGLPQPYSVGYIDMANSNLRVFCLLGSDYIEDLKIGMAVVLAVKPLGHDSAAQACLRPFFVPDNDRNILVEGEK